MPRNFGHGPRTPRQVSADDFAFLLMPIWPFVLFGIAVGLIVGIALFIA